MNAEQSECPTLSDFARVLGFTPKYRHHTPKSCQSAMDMSNSILCPHYFVTGTRLPHLLSIYFPEYKTDTSTRQRAREKARTLWRYEDKKMAQIFLVEPSSINSPASMSPRGSKTRQGNRSLHTHIPVILSLVPEIRSFLAFIDNFLSREHPESAGNERIVECPRKMVKRTDQIVRILDVPGSEFGLACQPLPISLLFWLIRYLFHIL